MADFHGEPKAEKAQADFAAQFQERSVASEMATLQYLLDGPQKLFRILTATAIAPSGTEAQRQIKAGAVDLGFGELDSLNWQTVTDPTYEVDPDKDGVIVVRYGKRKQYKISFKP